MKFTFIGDTHNLYYNWIRLTEAFDRTIQIGDFGMWSKKTGFNAWELLKQTSVDPTNHKILGGNHEDYRICQESPFYLGDFGVYE